MDWIVKTLGTSFSSTTDSDETQYEPVIEQETESNSEFLEMHKLELHMEKKPPIPEKHQGLKVMNEQTLPKLPPRPNITVNSFIMEFGAAHFSPKLYLNTTINSEKVVQIEEIIYFKYENQLYVFEIASGKVFYKFEIPNLISINKVGDVFYVGTLTKTFILEKDKTTKIIDIDSIYVFEFENSIWYLKINGDLMKGNDLILTTLPHSTFQILFGDDLYLICGKTIAKFNLRNFTKVDKFSTTEIKVGNFIDFRVAEKYIFSIHVDGKLIVWNILKLKPTHIFTFSKITAFDVVDGKIWIGSEGGNVNVLLMDEIKDPWPVLCKWKACEGEIVYIKSEGNRTITCVSKDGNVNIWRVNLDQFICCKAPELKNKIKFHICSWNVDAQKPPSQDFFRKWLKFDVDLVVVGLQEIVDLNKKSRPENGKFWVEELRIVLPKNFKILGFETLVGLFMLVACRDTLEIKDITWNMVKTGIAGLYGNKGAIEIKFKIEGSLFRIINCHLAAGQTNVTQRNNDVCVILEQSIADHIFFFGDLNYRIDPLTSKDQLEMQKKNCPTFPLNFFKEAEIKFQPTYKYDRGTDNIDTSEKQRIPSYCDRILYYSKQNRYQFIEYDSIQEMNNSDHKPIFMTIELF